MREYFKKTTDFLIECPLRRFGLFSFGCAVSFGLKLLLTNLLIFCGFSVGLAYFARHIVIIFFAFYYHFTFTFTAEAENFHELVKVFIKFFNSVILLKIVDYLLVVGGSAVLFKFLEDQAELTRVQISKTVSICILAAGVTVFALRFFLHKYVFEAAESPAKQKDTVPR